MSKCIYDTTRECPTITNENGYTYPKYKDCVDCFKTRCIEVPEQATNGDIFMASFPDGVLYDYDEYVIYELNYQELKFDRNWWYAPYVIPGSKN